MVEEVRNQEDLRQDKKSKKIKVFFRLKPNAPSFTYISVGHLCFDAYTDSESYEIRNENTTRYFLLEDFIKFAGNSYTSKQLFRLFDCFVLSGSKEVKFSPKELNLKTEKEAKEYILSLIA